MKRFVSRSALACLSLAVIGSCLAPQAFAVQVWESTFDSTADGVVDISDNNFSKDMIGGVSDGRLQITTMDNTTDSYTPDKAGRPMELDQSNQPVPRTYNTSQSAQYKFRWSAMPTADEGAMAYHFAGFLGNTTIPQTRQIMGTLMTHWNVEDNYYMRIGLAAMGVGFTDFGLDVGPVINLGPNPIDTDYELRIEFDGTTHLMSVKLLDATATLIAENTRDLDIQDTVNDADGLWSGWFAYGPTNFTNETNSISLTHLGWEDYTGYGGDKTWTWQVDSMAYWDEGTVPLPFTEPIVADADYNDDGTVDAADYVIWQKYSGATGAPGTVPGDGTSSDLLGVPNGVVDQFDYDFWLSQFGASSGGSGSGGVPEPSTAVMCLISAAMLAGRRRAA